MFVLLSTLVVAIAAQGSVTLVGPTPVEPVSVELPEAPPPAFRLKPCAANPKPYFCFLEGNTKNPAVCPPPEFDAAKNFTLSMLAQYVNAPWYTQYMVRSIYEPVDAADLLAGFRVANYANVGLNGEIVGSFGPDTAKQLAVILDPERPNRIRMLLKFLRSLPEAKKYGTDYVIAAAGSTPGQPVDPDTEFTWAIVTSGPPQLKAEFGPGCRPYQIDDEGSSVSITAQQLGWSPPTADASGEATNASLTSQEPAEVIIPLLFEQLGFNKLETVVSKIFDPVPPQDFDLAGVLAIVDPVDLRPLLPLLEDPDFVSQVTTAIEEEVGGPVYPYQVIETIKELDSTQPISLSQVLATVLRTDPATLSFFVKIAPTTVPDEVGQYRQILRGLLVSAADSNLLPNRSEGLWLLTREQVPPQELLDEMMRVARRLGLNVNVLQKVVQEGCEYEGAPTKKVFIPVT